MGEAKRTAEARRKHAEAHPVEPMSPPEPGPRRTVTVDVTVRFTTDVPADWDDSMVEFWIVDSSLCGGTFVAGEIKRDSCGCDKIQGAKVVR